MKVEQAEPGLRSLILLVCGMVGIKELPDNLFNQIMRYISIHNGHLTFQEMYLAFEMNLASKLSKRHEHYQCFDLGYWSSVINDFLILRGQCNKKLDMIVTEQDKPEEKKASPESVYTSVMNYIEGFNEVPKYWDWESVYIYLDEKGEINMTKEEKREFVKKVVKQIHNDMFQGAVSSEKLIAQYKEAVSGTRLETECRRQVVRLYLVKYIQTPEELKAKKK